MSEINVSKIKLMIAILLPDLILLLYLFITKSIISS